MLKYNSISDDKELFSLISQGNETAFEQLFHRYVPEIRPIILQIVKTEAATQDIIQEVFLYLWLGREKLAEIETPRHWIFRITYNRSYQFVKRQLLQEKAVVNSGMATNIEPHQQTTENDINFAETTRLVQQGIAQLGEQSRKIYELHRNAGMKAQEIAGLLGISTQSVRNSLTRSGKQIRDHLANHGISIPLILLIMQIG